MTPKRTRPGSSAFSPSVEALLAQERVLIPKDDGVRARALARAEEAVRAGLIPPRSVQRLTRRGGSQSLLAGAAGIVVIGGVIAVFQWLGAEAPRTPPAAPAQPAHSAVPAKGPAPLPEVLEETASPTLAVSSAPSAASVSEGAPVPSSRPVSSRGRANGLDELTLLHRARQADSRGDFTTVLALADEHRRSYPAGQLAEEREVLRVKALIGLGKPDQARRAAAKFRRQFPQSVLLHRLDEMLLSRP